MMFSLTDRSNDGRRAGVEFVTFHVALTPDENVHPNESLACAEQRRMIRLMFKSVKLFHPGASTTLLTDARTRRAGGVRPGKWVINEVKPENLMLERAIAQQRYVLGSDMSSPMVLLDSDILLNGSLERVFRHPFDVALTWRAHDDMPVNGGFIILNNARPDASKEFFKRFVSIYQSQYAERASWFGDQLALRDFVGLRADEMSAHDIVERDGCRILLLPCTTYNFSPNNHYRAICSPLSDKVVLHFKGQRKRLMAPFWKARLRPAHSRQPWAQFIGWRERRRIARQAEFERLGSTASVPNPARNTA